MNEPTPMTEALDELLYCARVASVGTSGVGRGNERSYFETQAVRLPMYASELRAAAAIVDTDRDDAARILYRAAGR